ncbi:hypothetical protein SteCoe_29521 [Stentor coeruleus]|uniref:CRC domain-containing protein n=1 Tax=Stentor coeruleus TaxID=5963 RepID=A0A1R2B5P7_9CILI|nr:hypothetical protein SteCoe_29521 [Stentor coeruleus]
MESFEIKMDKNSNCLTKVHDDTFAQYCLQTLAPLISFPFFSEDWEMIKSQNTPCNCSKSGCLKLYCECFSKGRYCIGCNCINCFNVPEYESIRNKAVTHLLHRNSEAFATEKNKTKGCTCRKSGCLKKYCRCHVNGKFCDESCKCVGCKNLSYAQISS